MISPITKWIQVFKNKVVEIEVSPLIITLDHWLVMFVLPVPQLEALLGYRSRLPEEKHFCQGTHNGGSLDWSCMYHWDNLNSSLQWQSERGESERVTILAEINNLDYHEKSGLCRSNPNFSWSGRNMYEYKIFTKACLSISIPSNNSHWPIVKTTIQ